MIYHYTDLSVFEEIIKLKKLRATNFKYLNDSQEYYWLAELVDKYITAIQESERNSISIYFADIQKELNFRQNLIFPFIISFSKNGDLLSQWRAYGHNANGVSLGFELKDSIHIVNIEEAFKDIDPSSQAIPIYYSKFYCFDVSYFPKNGGHDFLKSYIDRAYSHFKNKFGVVEHINTAKSDYYSLMKFYSHNLWAAAISTKHVGFEEEKEVRIGWVEPITIHTGEYSFHFKNNVLKHRTGVMGLTPYIELDIIEHLKLKEITLGPKYNGSLWDVKDFIEKNGFDIHEVIIKKSEIPFR